MKETFYSDTGKQSQTCSTYCQFNDNFATNLTLKQYLLLSTTVINVL